MQRVSVALATALMLGGMSMAYAQGGPPQKENGPAQAQEQKGPSGGASRGAQAQENQGGSAKSESRAERSGGENQRSAGQSGQDGASGKSSRQQAQDEGGRKQKDSDRASKQDDDSKSAQRSGQDEDKSKRAQSKDDDSSKRAERKDDGSKDAKRAGKEDDQSKDAKRAERDDDQSKDAKRADRDDRSQDDRKRADSGEGKKHVELKGDKEERVRNVFRERADVRERTDVDIDIHVGSRLPRDWEYYPVPAAVIEVVPEYRNYRFVYVEDRYVIIDPDTYQVVTVISSDGSRTHAAGGSGRCSADLALSDDDRRYLLQTVQMQNVDVGDVTIGMDVPSSVELHTFPSSVTQRVSVLGQCRYFVTGDRIAIVDPNQHEVVVLVD